MIRILLTLTLILSLTKFSQADVLLDVNFDQHANGSYSIDQLDQDFRAPQWIRGLVPVADRASIVTGDNAFDGSSLAVNCRGRGIGTSGVNWTADLRNPAREAYLSYRIRFEDGFNFDGGIKLPGLVGGDDLFSDLADGEIGWSTRMIVRPSGSDGALFSIAKYDQSGFQNRGGEDFRRCFGADSEPVILQTGRWYRILQRVRLNSVGQPNGILQVWLDGERVLDQNDVVFRNVAGLGIDRIYFNCFVDGSASAVAPDQFTFFDDVKVTVPSEQPIRVPDDYEFITTAVANSNPGDEILIRPGEHTVGITGVNITHPLTITGSASTLVRGTLTPFPINTNRNLTDDAIFDVNSADVRLQVMNISGGARGIHVFSNNVDVQIRFVNFASHAVSLVVDPNCHRIEVVACDFDNITGGFLRDIFRIIGCDDAFVSRTTSNGGGILTIENCVRPTFIRNVAIRNPNETPRELFAVIIAECSELMFALNHIEGSRSANVQFREIHDSFIISNTIIDARGPSVGNNLSLVECDSLFVAENEIANANGRQIFARALTNSEFFNNVIRGSNDPDLRQREVIRMTESTENLFSNNEISGCCVDGFLLSDNSNFNMIVENQFVLSEEFLADPNRPDRDVGRAAIAVRFAGPDVGNVIEPNDIELIPDP